MTCTPHFGFFYKAVATKITVYLYDIAANSEVKIIDEGIVNPIGNTISTELEWRYVSKNLSLVAEYISTVNAGSEKMWQVTRMSKHSLEINML